MSSTSLDMRPPRRERLLTMQQPGRFDDRGLSVQHGPAADAGVHGKSAALSQGAIAFSST